VAKKKQSKKVKPKPKAEQSPSMPKPMDEEKPFDFGGLPQRDLKKNLGC
jgi:hypothetical protein